MKLNGAEQVGEHHTNRTCATTATLASIAKLATYSRDYAKTNGFMTLLSDGECLTSAFALGPEAGEWLQQATLAIRARVPLAVLRDNIQPFPTFSEIYLTALQALDRVIASERSQRSPTNGRSATQSVRSGS